MATEDFLKANNYLIRSELKPGDIGYITYLHGILYAKEQGWDPTFEAYVAGPLSEFAKSKSTRQKIWIVEVNNKVAGSIAIVEHSPKEAQLRWLLLDPGLRGQGLGRKLMDLAIAFGRTAEYESIFLWTVSSLTVAAGLYRAFGFQRIEELAHRMWGQNLVEEKYQLFLK